MTSEEIKKLANELETSIAEHLAVRYILIPKNKFYYALGGFVATLVAVFGIGWSSVRLAHQSTEGAKATKQIKDYEAEAKASLDRLKSEDILKNRDWVTIVAGRDDHAVLSGENNPDITTPSGDKKTYQRWRLVRDMEFKK